MPIRSNYNFSRHFKCLLLSFVIRQNFQAKAVSNMLTQFQQALTQHAIQDGFTPSLMSNFGVFRASQQQTKNHAFYQPFICLMGQGVKRCHVGDHAYTYETGDFFINFLPTPVTSEILQADDKTPMLSGLLEINLVSLADMVLRIERCEKHTKAYSKEGLSSLMVGKADDRLLALFNKLIDISYHPLDAKILGEAVVDEIYYRILTSEYGDALRHLLNQYGGIQPISRAITYIHDHPNRMIQVQELAEIANMSKTRFFNAFKQVMHVPPMQYIKSSKLQKARLLLKQGLSATETSFQVGYSSFSQFSREYKRFYGFPPSQTQRIA